ncbi:DUF2625 family protein [Hamadaea tsunoensis]|uniref:DUF2625 family protein n=1 Tax=Hamadaea tsunoensis TaxID=53368 RepID=UPI0004876685|nr:DUF2625 family protein [Hamadaea tsunoensis]
MTEAWPEILAVVAAAPYPVEVVPANPGTGRRCRERLEITTRSWLGSVAAYAGGILVDHGWLRVLGSGAPGWVALATRPDPEIGGITVGYDVLGGRFHWGQSTPDARPTVHYYGPDTLSWQDLELGYADWLRAVLSGALTEFAAPLRWPGWEEEVGVLAPDQGVISYPPPSTREGKNLADATRSPAPLLQIVAFHSA